ncbi:MAG: ribbon-helix-helix protein, CopG family [Actinomycetota bacterium]|nr:ribbon-helix-helix protein, CopG family [Actinomycetota bacterium]
MTTKRRPLTIAGRPITDEMVEKAAGKAEAGFDAERLVRRPGGRPLLGSAPAGNISVRFPPDLRQQLQAHARAEHVAEAEVIRRAVRDYLDRTQAS